MANKRTNHYHYLCEEMIFNILSYLPVISLLRFKLVCKTWLSIISNPQFEETHLTNSKNKQASVLKASYNWRVYSVDTHEESVRLKLPSHCKGMVCYIRSCNGLVCLSNSACDILYIWNPCTRQIKMLPVPNSANYPVPIYLGFGFDSIANDYKILRIAKLRIRVPLGFIVSSKPGAQLYSANADSWKNIHVPMNIRTSFWHRPRKICGPDINGVLYWEGNGGLLSFDLHNEVFGEIGVLEFPNHVQHNKSNVLDFEGSVAMVFESACDESVLSLWTLDGVCGIWTKKFNLETDLELDRVYLYLGAEQFVGLNFVFGYKFYDYRKKTTKKLPFPAHLTDVKLVVKFSESLVSLKGFQLQE